MRKRYPVCLMLFAMAISVVLSACDSGSTVNFDPPGAVITAIPVMAQPVILTAEPTPTMQTAEPTSGPTSAPQDATALPSGQTPPAQTGVGQVGEPLQNGTTIGSIYTLAPGVTLYVPGVQLSNKSNKNRGVETTTITVKDEVQFVVYGLIPTTAKDINFSNRDDATVKIMEEGLRKKYGTQATTAVEDFTFPTNSGATYSGINFTTELDGNSALVRVLFTPNALITLCASSPVPEMIDVAGQVFDAIQISDAPQ